MKRTSRVERKTKETEITVSLQLEGKGKSQVTSPIGFFNHMLETFTHHGMFDIDLKARGDVNVDQHHLVEDCGMILGKAFDQALGDKKGICRAGYFVYPMDEALAVVAVDISGRPYLQYEVTFRRRFCGEMDTDVLEDFFHSFSVHSMSNLVVRMPFGRSDHHRMESIFKAWGRAMRMACSLDPRRPEGLPSVKGVIDDRDR
ncbi:imidazoleglycerol-phosphate dehydratase HisB [bacterium]|nr:imidazoleglycerol-phosphate dehydratase HisB [bacterium]